MKVTTTTEISSCDKLCVINSIKTSRNGKYHYLYFNTTLNGPVYYNAVNGYYLHPYVKSECLYSYMIQPLSRIGTGYCYSYCDIVNPPPGYTFDPNDCFKGWQEYDSDNDIFKDNPNQRLINCNNVSVTGNDKSWLDGTYVWSQFSLDKHSSIYYCRECGLQQQGTYIYAWPDSSYWLISDDYTTSARWSKCTYSSAQSNGQITLDSCGQWSTWDGSTSNIETNMIIETYKCPFSIDTSSITGPECTKTTTTATTANASDDREHEEDVSWIGIGIAVLMVLGLWWSFYDRYFISKSQSNFTSVKLVIILSVNTTLGVMTIWVVTAHCCVNYSPLTAFVVVMPLAEWCAVNFIAYTWYQSNASSECPFFWTIAILCMILITFGTSTACFMVSSKYIAGMMLLYCLLTLVIAVMMYFAWDRSRYNKAMKKFEEPLIQLQHANDILQKTTEFIWQWKDDKGNWNSYDNKTSKTISDLKVAQTFKWNLLDQGQEYIITKTSTETAEQLNKASNKSRDVRRIGADLKNAVNYPSWWQISTRHVSQELRVVPHYAKPALVTLDLNKNPGKTVVANFKKTCTDRKVVKVESVENMMLYESYWNARVKLIKLIGERNLNEQDVFHGTNNFDVMQKIQKEGFRKEFTSRAKFGEGTYFAKNASYSVGFSCSNNGVNQMFQCRVMMGQNEQGKAEYKLKSWPKKNNGNGLMYDSLVDNKQNPTLFVIHENDRAYPMFVVHFI